MAKRDPYAALRFKEFNIFLLLRFILVFGWSMQFIIIEWQVYTLTKDPLSSTMIESFSFRFEKIIDCKFTKNYLTS